MRLMALLVFEIVQGLVLVIALDLEIRLGIFTAEAGAFQRDPLR